MLAKVLGLVITISLASILMIGGLALIGAMIEGIGDWQVEHERCLKKAPNAFEARRCH